MYGYLIDVIIWSFAIYGFVNFCREFWLDAFCYIFEKIAFLGLFFKKSVAKFYREMYNIRKKKG